MHFKMTYFGTSFTTLYRRTIVVFVFVVELKSFPISQ